MSNMTSETFSPVSRETMEQIRVSQSASKTFGPSGDPFAAGSISSGLNARTIMEQRNS